MDDTTPGASIPPSFAEATTGEQVRARAQYMEEHLQEWGYREYPELDHEWLQPSDAWLTPILSTLDNVSRADEDAMLLEHWYWDERTTQWVRANATREADVEALDDFYEEWREDLDKHIPLPSLSVEAVQLHDEIADYAAFRKGEDLQGWIAYRQRIDALLERGDHVLTEAMAFSHIDRERRRLSTQWVYRDKGLFPFLGGLWRPLSDPPPVWLLRHAGVMPDPYGANDTSGLVGSRKAALFPTIPSAFRDGLAVLPSCLPVQGLFAGLAAASYGVQSADQPGWHQSSNGVLYYVHQKTSGTITLSWQLPEAAADSPELATLLTDKFREIASDLDGDVLSAALIQSTYHAEAEGWTWLDAATILDYRGIRPVKPREGKTTHRGGHRTEDVREIAASWARLDHLFLDLQQVTVWEDRGSKKSVKTRLTLQDKVLAIRRRITQGSLLDGDALPIAWYYRPGDWLAPFLSGMRQTALMLQTILAYDPYRRIHEKRLGRYLTFHMRIDNKNLRPLRREVGTLLEECWLPIDTDRPQRTKDRLEVALGRLKNDGIIANWEYASDAGKDLPPRNWLKDWEKQVVIFTAPAPVAQHYELPARKARALAAARKARS